MKKYEAPEVNVIVFRVEDIIATSGIAIGGGDNEFTAPADWWN